MLKRLLDAARKTYTDHPDLFVVLISGLVGGLFAASVQALFRSGGDLTIFAVPKLNPGQYIVFGGFGALAAGFSVYLVANSQRDDLRHLCFFALSCGIGFPAVLLETQTATARQVQDQIKNAATVVTDATQSINKVAPAAAALATEAVTQTPASKVDSQTRAIVSDQASALIEKLNDQKSPIAAAAAQNVFNAATQAGYTEITSPTASAK